jgi:hypothetical protein
MTIAENNSLSAEGGQTEPVAKKSHRRMAIVLLIWLVVCSGALTTVVRAVQAAREAARCATCAFNLRQIGVGLRYFDAANGGLPSAYLCDENGKPIHSWQALVAPYIGHYTWRDCYSLTEPWNGPNNNRVLSRPFPEFQCPSADDPSPLTIDYVAVIGPETMWPGRDCVALLGNRDVILLIEMPDSDYRCLEPRFPTEEEFMAKIKSPTGKGIRCIHPRGLAYLTVGGEVRWFRPDTDPETIRNLLKRDPDCKVIPAQERMKIIENWEQAAKEGK